MLKGKYEMRNLIDAMGKPCPIPVILAKKALDSGINSLTITVDNEIAVENLKKLAASQQLSVVTTETVDGFQVSMSADSAEKNSADTPKAPADKPAEILTTDGLWVVLQSKETLGSGDDDLGKNLARMYFYTLAESEKLPDTVIFINGGVKLATTDEQVVGHLKTLSSRGVEILLCGTCLDFYNLADRMSVGAVSNMYEISERLAGASHTVTL